MAGSCELSNEPSIYIEGGTLLVHLNDCPFLEEAQLPALLLVGQTDNENSAFRSRLSVLRPR
jgi:hypothetical protein